MVLKKISMEEIMALLPGEESFGYVECQVEDYQEFLETYGLHSDLEAGIDGSDFELIEDSLERFPGLWICHFEEDSEGGHFRIMKIMGVRKNEPNHH